MSFPLVTFALFAYNQERFIREAVEGALAQTYSPLEIILSDDCSPDRTFEIMQEMAAAYRGPHKIILNRNQKNLGMGSHLNRLMELASGEIIVVGAGDDISLPERTEHIQREFAASGGKAMAVFSDMTEIDGNGNFLKHADTRPRPGFDHLVQCCQNMLGGITGASNAWHRKVFDVFGPLLPEIIFEDRVIALRAALLGGIRHIPEPLVRYRRHETNTVAMFHSTDLKQARRTLECFLSAYRNSATDLETFINKIQPDFPEASRCRRMIQRRIGKLESYLWIHSGSPGRMIRGLFGLVLKGGNPIQGVKLCGRVLCSRSASTSCLSYLNRYAPKHTLRHRTNNTQMRVLLKDLRCWWRRIFFGWLLRFRPVSPGSALVIAPHPDDETFGCGNIIALKKQQGARVQIIFLTDGGDSMKAHSSITPQEVMDVRKQQSIEACAHLGLSPDDLKRYSLPDGQVPRKGMAGFEEAVIRLLNDIREFAPSEIICPHPLDGHGDHLAAAEMAQEALRQCKSPPRLLFYTIWVWFTAPWGIRKYLDFSSAWKVDGRTVSLQKIKAINIYLQHLEPSCGIPYYGKLHRSVLYCARQSSEILFEQHIIGTP